MCVCVCVLIQSCISLYYNTTVSNVQTVLCVGALLIEYVSRNWANGPTYSLQLVDTDMLKAVRVHKPARNRTSHLSISFFKSRRGHFIVKIPLTSWETLYSAFIHMWFAQIKFRSQKVVLQTCTEVVQFQNTNLSLCNVSTGAFIGDVWWDNVQGKPGLAVKNELASCQFDLHQWQDKVTHLRGNILYSTLRLSLQTCNVIR